MPLLYRKTQGLVQLFRCAHKPDFVSASGDKCSPFKTLDTLGKISNDPWWDDWRLRNGTIWDDPKTCGKLMSDKSAHKLLLKAVKELHDELNEEGILKKQLRRKLLILSLLIAYLEERAVLLPDFFGQFLAGANRFFQVLADGEALIALLEALEVKFNGNVFKLAPDDAASLRNNGQLARFARIVEAKQEKTGQRTLWELYSFRDLPIELISHIYQMFVEDKDTAIYTPPFLVRLMLDEALGRERLDRLHENDEVIADFSCGSGVFLVEAYKRLVLHWRSRNGWRRPGINVLKGLLKKLHGIDLEKGAVELAAFSLYLAMCDALEPEDIRSSIKLFPALESVTLHQSCFFEARELGLIALAVIPRVLMFSNSVLKNRTSKTRQEQLTLFLRHAGLPLLSKAGGISISNRCCRSNVNAFQRQGKTNATNANMSSADFRPPVEFSDSSPDITVRLIRWVR